MGGRIHVSGASTGAGGADPFIWNDTTNQALTEVESEGVTLVESTGVFTVDTGYGGEWLFTFCACMTSTSSNNVITFDLVSDPAGSPTVIMGIDRKVGSGSDVGAVSLTGIVTAAEGGTFGIRVSGDANLQLTKAYLSAHQLGNDQ